VAASIYLDAVHADNSARRTRRCYNDLAIGLVVIAKVKRADSRNLVWCILVGDDNQFASGVDEVSVSGVRGGRFVVVLACDGRSKEGSVFEVRRTTSGRDGDDRVVVGVFDTALPVDDSAECAADMHDASVAKVWVFVVAVMTVLDAIAEQQMADTFRPVAATAELFLSTSTTLEFVDAGLGTCDLFFGCPGRQSLVLMLEFVDLVIQKVGVQVLTVDTEIVDDFLGAFRVEGAGARCGEHRDQ